MIGLIEMVKVSTEAVKMAAKVDTGADFSSVHADIVRFFHRNGKQWVEFILHDQNGDHRTLQKAVQRMAKIKKKSGGSQERPVVLLQLCVGSSMRKVFVNIAQRSHFNYPLLLGRNFLSGRYIVDPSQKYLLTPACQ